MALKTFAANHENSAVLKLDLFNHDNIQIIEDYLNEHKIKIDVL